MKTAALVFTLVAVVALAQEPASHHATKADVDRWMVELSNWGRWGKDDQMGAVNLITPAKRKAAAALVKDGVSVSLARDADTEKSVDNASPYVHKMLSTGARPNGPFVMDEYSVNYHGLAHTHMDALTHMAWQGKMYNGIPQTEVTDHNRLQGRHLHARHSHGYPKAQKRSLSRAGHAHLPRRSRRLGKESRH